jgi:hypothetical protein
MPRAVDAAAEFLRRRFWAMGKGVDCDDKENTGKHRIKSHESFEKWGIDQARWATAHI